jgi:hypothetical protein
MENVFNEIGEKETLQVSPQLKEYLKRLAYWSKVLGIFGLVFSTIGILGLIFSGTLLASYVANPMMKESSIIYLFIGIYGLILVFYAYIAWLGFDYGRKMKTALVNNNQGYFEEAVPKLSLLIKIQGIAQLVFVGLYILFMVYAGTIAKSAMNLSPMEGSMTPEQQEELQRILEESGQDNQTLDGEEATPVIEEEAPSDTLQ